MTPPPALATAIAVYPAHAAHAHPAHADRAARTPPRADRATVMAALAARHLDTTLTTSGPVLDPADETMVGHTAMPALDAVCGGVPRGQLSELVGAASTGVTSVALHMCAAATARGELVAYLDALDRFDPESAALAGIDLSRLLWIRGQVTAHPGQAHESNQRALEHLVKAWSLVLQAGNFGCVVFDVADVPVELLRRLPLTTWLRVSRMLEGSSTIGLIAARAPLARSPRGLTVRLAASGHGAAREARVFTGRACEVRITSARASRATDVPVPLVTAVRYRTDDEGWARQACVEASQRRSAS